MGKFDSAADVKIYDYKTRSIHEEKCCLLMFRENGKIACLGNECTQYIGRSELESEPCIPIKLGRVVDYTAAENFFKYLHRIYIKKTNGKPRLFKRSNKILLFLHEPCSEVDKKIYMDLMAFLGYANVILITSETNLGGMSPEEAIWSSEEVHGKIDCAFEIGKKDLRDYARYAEQELKKDLKRWGCEGDEE